MVDANLTRDGSVTIAELINAYMSAYSGRDSTRPQRLRWWNTRLGTTTLAQLSDDQIFYALEELATRRGRFFAGLDADNQPILKAKTKNLSNASINRYCAALSAVLTWAVHRRLAPKNWQNPCHSIEQRPEKNEIVRYLSDAERTALLTACKASKWPRLYLLALMGLTTGARRGELEGLRWRDINLERAEASVHQSKNGDRKTLPLTPAVIQELKKFQGPPASLIFASTRRPDVAYNNVPVWTKALKDAGVRNFRFHDLRHSCASALAQDGATLLQIADVLGHRQMSVTKRYSHLATSHKSELINRVLGDIR